MNKKAPAGTSKVPGLTNVFLDKIEITNIVWREYLYYLKNEEGADSESYKSAQFDIAVWKQAYPTVGLNSSKYDYYPVVGISYQQALDYCAWRSKIVSAKENRTVNYSLPTLKVYKMSGNLNPNKTAEGLFSTKIGFRTFLGICENAAEMTNVEGIAIEGYNRNTCLEQRDFIVPSQDLGFRCMALLP